MSDCTDLEKSVIRAIAENEYGDGPGSDVWSWSVTDDFESPRAAAGALGSLQIKGLVATCGSRGKEATVRLTDAGIAVWNQIKTP